MARTPTALIIGGGIAGLMATISLSRLGLPVRLFERAPEFQPLGAGLIMWGNALKVFRALGMEGDALRVGQQLQRMDILTPDGSALGSADAIEIASRTGAAAIAVHRADLMDLLVKRLPDGCVEFGHEFTGFEEAGGRITARFANGAEATGDILIGADGIWSRVREQIHGPQDARYSGQTAWRSVIEWDRADERLGRSSETWGLGTRFGWVPLGRGRVYWFAVKNALPGQSDEPDGRKAELLRLFRDWHEPIPETLALSEETAILRHDLYDRVPSLPWGAGQVTLAGDAAHPTTPNMGQGACMAIEDALVLTDCLDRYQTIEAGLRAYEAERHSRAAMVTNLSWRMGKIAQVQNPLAYRLRNTVVRWTPDIVSLRQTIGVVDWDYPERVQPQWRNGR